MKKKIVLFLFMMIIGITSVNAYTGDYYYELEDGKYRVCTNDECAEIVKGQEGFIFDLGTSRIISATNNNKIYLFNADAQKEYQDQVDSKTKMFFYQNKYGNYVLCETENSCKTYTFDELASMGAVITPNSTVVFRELASPGQIELIIYNYRAQETEKEQNDIAPTTDYCTRLKEPLKFLGNVVIIVKILIPVLIIAFGMMDFFRAIIGSKDDEIKKSAKSLLMRAISGVIIFFIPTIVSVIFSLIGDFANIQGDFDACQKCIFRVSQCK